MTEQAFAKHSAWKRQSARLVRNREVSRQSAAERDTQFWKDHLDEIVARREARVTQTETRAERIAAKRAAWKVTPPL